MGSPAPEPRSRAPKSAERRLSSRSASVLGARRSPPGHARVSCGPGAAGRLSNSAASQLRLELVQGRPQRSSVFSQRHSLKFSSFLWCSQSPHCPPPPPPAPAALRGCLCPSLPPAWPCGGGAFLPVVPHLPASLPPPKGRGADATGKPDGGKNTLGCCPHFVNGVLRTAPQGPPRKGHQEGQSLREGAGGEARTDPGTLPSVGPREAARGDSAARPALPGSPGRGVGATSTPTPRPVLRRPSQGQSRCAGVRGPVRRAGVGPDARGRQGRAWKRGPSRPSLRAPLQEILAGGAGDGVGTARRPEGRASACARADEGPRSGVAGGAAERPETRRQDTARPGRPSPLGPRRRPGALGGEAGGVPGPRS